MRASLISAFPIILICIGRCGSAVALLIFFIRQHKSLKIPFESIFYFMVQRLNDIKLRLKVLFDSCFHTF